jgi:hypothetical protein
MTFINLIPDDLGIQRLKSENAQPGTTRAVTPVEPYPSQQANQPQALPVPPPRKRRKPRKGERRAGERRKRQEPVILDTRASQDRREITDRREDEAETRPPPRIDLFV